MRLARALTTIKLLLISFCSLHAAAQGVSHQAFDVVLRANVSDGKVNYPAIGGDSSFRDYVAQLAAPVNLGSKTDKLVYYMNAYNALAIQGILDGLSPSSIIGRQRYFKLKKWKLAGAEISLHKLEHEILRPLGEPRIHFAIVCASRSCPKIRADVFSAAKLEDQLEDNTRGFVNDPTRNRFDARAKTAQISEIFKWFEEDFVNSSGSVQKFIARYVNDAEVAKGLAAGEYKISYLEYNWGLNGTPPAKN